MHDRNDRKKKKKTFKIPGWKQNFDCLLWKCKGPWIILNLWYWRIELWVELKIPLRNINVSFCNIFFFYINQNVCLQCYYYYNVNPSHFQVMMMINKITIIQKHCEFGFFFGSWNYLLVRLSCPSSHCWNMWEQCLCICCKRIFGSTSYKF